MSVIVKNMKMPKNCSGCPLNYDQMACKVTGTRWWSDTMVLMGFDSDKERLYDCPLVELPPHGRLIDVDQFKADYHMKDDCAECNKVDRWASRRCDYDRIYSKMDFCGWLDDAEVVIEAEGSET